MATLLVTQPLGTSWRSGPPVAALLELGVVQLVAGDREASVAAVGRSRLEEGDGREDVLLGAAVLADEAAQVGEALAAGEGPEGLLAEVQVDRGVARGGRRQRGHRRRRDRAEVARRAPQGVEDRHHPRDVV